MLVFAARHNIAAADRSIKQAPDDRLGGRIPGQIVQVALNGGGSVFLTHSATIGLGEVACRGILGSCVCARHA